VHCLPFLAAQPSADALPPCPAYTCGPVAGRATQNRVKARPGSGAANRGCCMYAIIEGSGGQLKVAQGDELLIDLVGEGQATPGQAVTFDKVLVVGEIGGGAKVGKPYVAGAKVTAEVVEPLVKGEKIHIYKFREKKGYRKKTGHRQQYTKVKITSIAG
jgi:large subunit ribosomal protein L21